MTDWLPIIALLVGVVVAFKLLKGIVKIGVIVLLLVVVLYLLGVAG